jgi:hypothetical protein
LQRGVEERLLCLLGVTFQRADELQDAPDVVDLPVRLAKLVEVRELGIVVTFQASLMPTPHPILLEGPTNGQKSDKKVAGARFPKGPVRIQGGIPQDARMPTEGPIREA